MGEGGALRPHLALTPFCSPTRNNGGGLSLEISWEYTQASQVRGRLSFPSHCHIRLYSCPRSKASAGTRCKIKDYWILQKLEPGKWKFKSQLCHVTWASYLTSLNFNLIFSSVTQGHKFQARTAVRFEECL